MVSCTRALCSGTEGVLHAWIRTARIVSYFWWANLSPRILTGTESKYLDRSAVTNSIIILANGLLHFAE